MRINLTDNNICRKDEGTFNRKDVSSLFSIANKTVSDLCRENNHVLIFPYDIEKSTDRIGDSNVLIINNTQDSERVRLITGNVMGFIGVGNIKLKIKSRFDNGRDDYFLHYMLQKVLSFNLFDLNHNNEQEDIFDFIMFMFPYFLKYAMRQGIYREYKRQEFNDARVKGSINISRFIRCDVPFSGCISYSNRNYSNDNDMTQLIRHTIEYMKTKKYGKNILNLDRETIENVRTIVSNTTSYDKDKRSSIIQKNLRPKVHPYYTEYKPLQTLCIQILRMEEIKYGADNNEICGILFDGAWLWEEYVNTVIKNLGFKHPENKLSNEGIFLFEDVDEEKRIHRSGIRYPDFYTEDFVLDAKYKRLGSYDKVSKVDRNDIHQLITYMTRLKADKGGFVAPLENKQLKIPTSHIKDSNSQLYIFGIEISKSCYSYEEFKRDMELTEKRFIKSLML